MGTEKKPENRFSELKYTLSYHYYPSAKESHKEGHFDLFFYLDSWDNLLHYKAPTDHYRTLIRFWKGKPHRGVYRDYSGPISGQRGRIRVLQKGILSFPEEFPEDFAASITPDGIRILWEKPQMALPN